MSLSLLSLCSSSVLPDEARSELTIPVLCILLSRRSVRRSRLVQFQILLEMFGIQILMKCFFVESKSVTSKIASIQFLNKELQLKCEAKLGGTPFHLFLISVKRRLFY
jgi:hypothetical protein